MTWIALALALAAAVASFASGLRFMVATWGQVEEFSYGYFIPLVSAFLIWQKADTLREQDLKGAWSGLWLLALGLALGALGVISAVRLFSQYGFVIALFGLSVCLLGWRGTRTIAVPLGVLFFMVPLPQFLLRDLSQQLQLWSSQLGVAMIRLADISVFLEGNVIDLGSYKLQVAEACSGLSYLFPLLVLAFLAAYFFNGHRWARTLIVLSAIPITIGINSFRIALIGFTVEHWGIEMAEGLLHFFEGWALFMVCLGLLYLEMRLLARLGGARGPASEAFRLDLPAPVPEGAAMAVRSVPKPLLWAGAALLLAGAYTLLAPEREQIKPDRRPFTLFPMALPGGWSGQPLALDREVRAILAVDDYLLANFTKGNDPAVNLYVAWYDSQSGGQSTHSPRTCIPGGGWRIVEFADASVPMSTAVAGTSAAPVPALGVNRAVIQRGEQRQLVYYWFKQRDRLLTGELAVKWYILLDGITRSRSDGALIRLVSAVGPGESLQQADARLATFLATADPALRPHLPD